MSDRAGFVDEDEELQEVQRLLERRQELMQVLDRQMREQAETIKREVIERKQRESVGGEEGVDAGSSTPTQRDGRRGGSPPVAVLEADVLFEQKEARVTGDPTLLEDRDFLLREMREQQQRSSLGIVSGYMSGNKTIKSKMSKMLRAIKKKMPLGERDTSGSPRQEFRSSVAQKRVKEIDVGDIREEESDDDEEVRRLQQELSELEDTVREEMLAGADESALLKQLEEINSLASFATTLGTPASTATSAHDVAQRMQSPPARPAPPPPVPVRDEAQALRLEGMLAGISQLELAHSPARISVPAATPPADPEPMC
jgi:hypothetical protein